MAASARGPSVRRGAVGVGFSALRHWVHCAAPSEVRHGASASQFLKIHLAERGSLRVLSVGKSRWRLTQRGPSWNPKATPRQPRSL